MIGGDPELYFSLLGPPRIVLNGKPLPPGLSAKARALLIYLSMEADSPHQRDFLAGFLWPDHPEGAARNNLRQALHQLRAALGEADPPFLSITRQTIQFPIRRNCSSDAAEFSALIRDCDKHAHRRQEACRACAERLRRAAALYRGEFLKGFFVKDSTAFEEWALVRREQFARQAHAAHSSLAEYHALRRDFPGMERAARKQIRIDPLQENAHRQLMRALAWSGKRNSALAHYEALCRMLKQELDSPPEEETTGLRMQIESGSLQPPEQPPLRNWPVRNTDFFGRERELAQIAEYLQNPDVHLVTITGAGGIGKTRLAMQAAVQEAFAFRNGACFVPLAEVSAPEVAVSAVAAALHFSLSDSMDPRRQLVDYLRGKEILLVLDGLDDLVDESELIGDILHACAAIRILATSREGLNLRGEWRLPIKGLARPMPEREADLESCAAVNLFIQRASQVQPEFILSGEERPALIRICELTDGMPLALELAAGWVKVLSCAQIADEIERSMSLLVTSFRDVPDRHRSMRAVFEHSWGLLSEAEQQAFRQMAVFHGGFRLEDAEAVVRMGAEPGGRAAEERGPFSRPFHVLLSSLVDKSLLQLTPSKRYEIHSLVRQYALERLRELPDEYSRLRMNHGVRFAALLTLWGKQLRGGEYAKASAEMNTEIDNLRAAWNWAVTERRWKEIGGCLSGLMLFYRAHGWWLEGEAAMGRAAASLAEAVTEDPQKEIVFGAVLVDQGVCCVQLGRYERAKELLTQSLSLLDPLSKGRALLAMGLGWLGTAELLLGKHDPAGEHLRRGLAAAEGSGDPWCTAMVHLLAGHYARTMDLGEAAGHYRTSSSLFRKLGDLRSLASAYHSLGEVMRLSGKRKEARKQLTESLKLARQAESRQLVGWNLASLGGVACEEGKLRQAQRYMRDSYAIARETEDIRTVIAVHLGLGSVASARRNEAEAEEHLHKALSMSAEARAWPQYLRSVIGWADLLSGRDPSGQERAVELMTLVSSHPLSWQENRIQAGILLKELKRAMSADDFENAVERSRSDKLERVVEATTGIAWKT
jgi:predicted ATPase/DNA-binding SARP family transcriptional activator